MSFYFYFARCNDNSLYSGSTNDIIERERKHNDGAGAKYTRSRGPVKIVYYEVFETRSEALKREWAVKKLTKIQKENLIISSQKKS